MKIKLHPNAAKNFDEKAQVLLSKLILDPNINQPRPETVSSEMFIRELKDAEITSTGYYNEMEGDIAKTFSDGRNVWGLFDESYRELVKLAENLQKTKGISEFVSVKLLTNLIFEWIADSYINKTQLSMCEDVLPKCEEKITRSELWFPVHRTLIETEIHVGKIKFKIITKQMIDDWHAWLEPHVIGDKEQAQVRFDQDRENLQGFAAATMEIEAEPQRAFEIAFDEAEKAISLLRFYTGAAFYPRLVSRCVLLGREHYEGYTLLKVNAGRIEGYSEQSLSSNSPFTKISAEAVAENFQHGLKELSALLAKGNRTEFEEELLNAVIQYSKSCLAKDVSDKLVYILVALESVLLKDGNEPIQKNIGERMAVLFGQTLEQRKAIIKNVLQTYGLRSSFIHHGKKMSFENNDTLTEFMINAWETLVRIVQIVAYNSGMTRQEFFDMVEEKRLSY